MVIVDMKNADIVEEDMKTTANAEDVEDMNDFYDWDMIPKRNSEETKTGVTFKGNAEEYIKAHGLLLKMLDKKGMKYFVNEREIRILDNAKNKPIKIEVKPLKGETGKVNIKLYNVNNKGGATIMISKVSDGKLFHVKALAFKVVKYLMDGIIDGEINEEDIESFKQDPNGSEGVDVEEGLSKESLNCLVCDKVFKTRHGLHIHCSKLNHTTMKCRKHIRKDHEVLQLFQCEYCDKKIEAESTMKGILEINKHHKECTCKPRPNDYSLIYKCVECDFDTTNELALKRHGRDMHNFLTKSISPQPKKRKQAYLLKEEDEKMDTLSFDEPNLTEDDLTIEGEVYWLDARDTSSKEGDTFIQRSKMQDEKIKKREQKLTEEEDRYKVEIERKKDEKNNSEHKKKEVEKLEKSRSKNKARNLKKRENSQKLKPYLKNLPDNCKELVGDDCVLFPVKGDGACGPNCAAAWIHQDPSLGPYLARNINVHFIKNWDYWKNVITFPFIREVGNGKLVKCENEEELFNFLLNSGDSAYMWRGHEDFSAVCSTYQLKIKIITIKSENDKNPTVNTIEPNPVLAGFSEFPTGLIPEMLLLHEENSHYNLIIPKSSMLAKEGGLDYQRSEALKKCQDGKKKSDLIPPDSQEEKIVLLEETCVKLLAENKKLATKLKKHEEKEEKKNMENKKSSEEEESLLLRSKQCGFKRISPHVQSENKNDRKEYSCNKCDYKLESEGLLMAHMQKHIEHQIQFQCDECDKEFSRKLQLEKHIRMYHKTEEVKTKQFNCEDCPFQGENGLELKKHVQRTKHCPSDYIEECHTCKREFPNYWELMNHRRSNHPSSRICRYFKDNCCKFDEETCWYRHESKTKLQDEHRMEYPCKECDKKFEKQMDLMKHKKMEHKKLISKCRNFAQGRCELKDNACWFLHDEEEMEVDVEDEQGFHEAPKKTPPDQLDVMMGMINQLTLQ